MKIFAVFLTSLMLAASDDPPLNSPPENKLVVEFQKGRMSVKADNVPLKDLLNEIEKKSGIVIQLKDIDAAERPSSVDFKNLLPTRAFREVLQDLNFAFFYSGTGLERVLILPAGTENPNRVGRLTNPTGQFAEWSKRGEKSPSKAKPKALVEQSKDSGVESKLAAIEAAEDSDDPKSIAALGEALTDPSSEVREAALAALSDKEGAAVTQMLRRGLNDADPEFRIEVLEALAERKDLDSLRNALSDRNQEVRERAAELLEDNLP
jgi:HEAT repeats